MTLHCQIKLAFLVLGSLELDGDIQELKVSQQAIIVNENMPLKSWVVLSLKVTFKHWRLH